MSAEFNIYHRVLGIPEHVRSPNHYDLLGLRPGESSAELIRSAADQRSRRLEPLLAGELGLLARRILAEIAAARDSLLDRQAKADYDRQLEIGVPSQAVRPTQPQRTQKPRRTAEVAESKSTGHPAPKRPPAARKESRPSQQSPQPQIAGPPAPAELPSAEVESPSGHAQAALRPLPGASHSPRVPIVGKMALDSILDELQQAMQECRHLYLASLPPSQKYLRPVSRDFVETQDRLHRGMLAKIYATIAAADGRWAWGELRCAEVLLRHLDVPFSSEDLKETARNLVRQAHSLDWQALFQPFRDIPELNRRSAELQTVIARVANLIAKADGVVTPDETAALQKIQDEFWSQRRSDSPVDPLPQVEPSSSSPLAANSQAGSIRHGSQAASVRGSANEAPWETPKPRARPRRKKVDTAKLRERRLQRLEALVGLREIKQEVYELADWVLFQSKRRKAKLPYEKGNLQFVLVGPSGTGKTLVAQLVSDLLFASGGLKHGQVVEANGYDLVSCDAREAADKMKTSLTQAIGGTLVVNDAGALMLADNASAAKALSVLRKNLAVHAGRLAVVLASECPDRLLPLLDRQADLPRLFQRRWHFADYSTSELGQIFQAHCDRSHYRVTRLARIKVLLGFHWCLSRDRKAFRNGHGAQRVFEQAVHRLSRRIAGVSPLTKDLLTTFRDVDIAIPGVPARVLGDLADARRLFAVTCPGCANVHLVGKDLLGIHVECKSCHHRFLSAWGEPVDG